jgi:hypothetical protein
MHAYKQAKKKTSYLRSKHARTEENKLSKKKTRLKSKLASWKLKKMLEKRQRREELIL